MNRRELQREFDKELVRSGLPVEEVFEGSVVMFARAVSEGRFDLAEACCEVAFHLWPMAERDGAP